MVRLMALEARVYISIFRFDNIFCIFFLQAKVYWLLFCLRRPFCIFGRCLDLNPESCRRYSRCATNLATHLPSQPPISLLSRAPISLLSHSSLCLATHLPTQPPNSHAQPPISLVSHPFPTYPCIRLLTQPIATHLPTLPSISLLSHPSPYLATRLPIYYRIHRICVCTVKCKGT